MRNILFVEDNSHKRTRVVDLIKMSGIEVVVDEACSYSSGSRKLEEKNYDLYLLDISLPTYDKSSSESGGRFRVFGGREIARKILDIDIECKIAFITQFNSFSEKGNSYTFDALQIEIANELREKFGGMIYYNSASSTWRDELLKVIKDIK